MNRMMSVVSCAAMFLAAGSALAEPTAVEIMEQARKNTKLDGAESLAVLTIYNAKGDKRVRKTAMVSKLYEDGKTEKRLIRFVAPADVKGTGLLTVDYEKQTDDMWLFMPALRKTRRIVASEKAKSFMGSEFSYADITPPAVEDFKQKIVRTEEKGGVMCWVIESVPINDEIAEENGYSKRVAHIGQPDYTIRGALLYDLDGELHKELTVHGVKEVDTEKHRYQPTHMVMVNKQNGRKSEMKVEQIQLRPDVPDDYFTTRYLERQ